jgi:hypothetical protein
MSDTAYYANAGLIAAGAAGGFWFTASFSIDSQAANADRVLISNGTWHLYLTGNNTYIYFGMFDASNTFRGSPVASCSGREIGKILTVTGVYDAAAMKMRLYFRRSEIGVATTTTGGIYSAGATGMYVGRAAAAGYGASSVTLYGFAYGHCAPAASVIAAHHDAALVADGRLSAIPGMTAHLYDLTLDANAGGGTIGATIIDRIGVNHLTRTGSPTTYARYNRTQGV